MRRLSCIAVVLMACLCLAQASAAQEALQSMLDRGYVKNWLVCGPFPSSDEVSILGKVETGELAFGPRDFMQPAGGIERLRPQHLQVIQVEGQGDALWQRAGTDSPQLDLAPFYPESNEGTSYAAFYTEAAAPTSVYMELHTPLGARVWLNGTPVVVPQEAALPLVGVDRTVLNFRQGMNFVVIQTPGAKLEELARVAEVSPQELSGRVFGNRTLLRGSSGFEIALTLKPMAKLGSLYYATSLESTGAFSGSAGDVRQEEQLLLFNPGTIRSSMVDILIKSRHLSGPQLVQVPGVLAGERYQALLPLPIGSTPVGSTTSANLSIIFEGETATFDASYTVLPRVSGGETLVLSGTRHSPASQESPEARLLRLSASLHEQLLLAEAVSTYGFEGGTAAEWEAWLALYPDDLPRWRALTQTMRGGVSLQYARVDERLAPPEVLARNIAYGTEAARVRLGATGVYDAWRGHGLAPQTPQLLGQADIPGVISQLTVHGLPALGLQAAPFGASVYHRHLASATGPMNVNDLRNTIAKQRRELFDQGFDTSLFLLENAVDPPEPFMQDAPPILASANPAIRISGDAAARYFEKLASDPAAAPGKLPLLTHDLLRSHPGELLASPSSHDAYRILSERLLAVEAASTIAAMEGAHFPYESVDYIWRVLAWYSQPDYLALSPASPGYPTVLSALGRAWNVLREVEQASLRTLAATVRQQPMSLPEGLAPLASVMLFAAAGDGAPRLCHFDVPVPEGREVRAFDTRGEALPCITGEQVPQVTPSSRPGVLRRVRFAAPLSPWSVDVVHLALAPEETAPPSDVAIIENDQWQVQIDPGSGDIVQLIQRGTGKNFAKGSLNQVHALGMEGSRWAQGRELWTNGVVLSPTRDRPKIETHKREGVQEMRVTSRLGDGSLVRTIRLWHGMPYVELEQKVSGLGGGNRLIASTLESEYAGRSFVTGERFGSLLTAPGAVPLAYRTDGMERESALGLRPAYRWAALMPGPELRFGLTRTLPLMPMVIVHPDALTAGVAQPMQEALLKRKVPSLVYPASYRKDAGLWSDATLFSDPESELRNYGGMLLLVGNPENNPHIKAVVAQLPQDAQERYTQGLVRGGIFAASHALGESTAPAVPVLMIGAQDAGATADLVAAMAEGIGRLGYHNLPEQSLLNDMPKVAAMTTDGIAVLFEGSRLAGLEPDGRVTLLAGLNNGSDTPTRMRYALMPLPDGASATELHTAASGFATPCLALELPEASDGKLAIGTTLLSGLGELVVSAIKPAGHAVAAGTQPDFPGDGLVLRTFNDGDERVAGELSMHRPQLAASNTGILETPTATDEAELSLEPNEIVTRWLLPSLAKVAPSSAMQALAMDAAPIFTAYPRHGEGIAPPGAQVLGMRLVIDWSNLTAEQALHLTNFTTDRVLSGELELSVGEDMSVGPASSEFQLQPGESQSFPLLLTKARDSRLAGAVLALATVEGRRFYDCALERPDVWLDVQARSEPGRVVVQVTNRMPVRAWGSIEAVTLPEHWPGMESGNDSNVLTPYALSLDLPPLAKQEFTFRVVGADAPISGLQVRVASNGKAEFFRVAGR